MKVEFDAYVNFSPEPNDYSTGEDQVRAETELSTPDLANAYQGDHPMEDILGLLPGADGDSLHDLEPEDLLISESSARLEDPLDYQAPHMLVLDQLPAVSPHHPPQTMNDFLATSGGPAQVPVHGNEVSQSSRYWEFLQSPQLAPPIQSSGDCPTILGLEPKATTTNPPRFARNTQPIGNPRTSYHPPPRSCDHNNCKPPSDIAFLSRRFTENQNWVRARAAAVASLACKRTGCRSSQTIVRSIRENEANQGVVI